MAQLPKLFESWQPVGTLTAEAAALLGLPADVIVCAGAGDNAAAAVGCGAVGGGWCNISLGTSGTVFITATPSALTAATPCTALPTRTAATT